MRAKLINESQDLNNINQDHKLNLLEWIQNFKTGMYSKKDRKTQIKAGWVDWFCKDTDLVKTTKFLGDKLIEIINSPKLNPQSQYLYFKNHQPVNGDQYDAMYICDIKTNDILYIIMPDKYWTSDNPIDDIGEVWSSKNNFDIYIVRNKWIKIKKWFNQK